MKKIVLSLFAVAALASTSVAQISYGPELGLNMSNYMGKSEGETQTTNVKAGLRIGGIVDIGLSDNFYLQPGIFYVMNGYKQSEGGTDLSFGVNTLEIPVNVEYKFGTPGGNRFFVGVGPYIALNLGGTAKFSGNFSSSESIKVGSDSTSDNIKAFDFGAGVNVGYQLASGFYARAHYQMGFLNLTPGGNSDNTMTNANFGVSVGYLFGGKKVKKATDTKK